MASHTVSHDAMLVCKELDDVTDHRQGRVSLNGEASAGTQVYARRMTHQPARAP